MAEAKWYIVHAYSNFENKVAASIQEQAERKGLEDLIEEIQVPSEEVVEVSRGKKKTVDRRFFPGYVLMKTALTDEIYHLVKDTPKVTGFLGAEGGKKPLPVRQREVDRILGTSDEASTAERARPNITFEIGEQVRVNDGPFQGFEGGVEEVDDDAARLKVTVSIFGRATPVDLEFGQVDKL
ncbi:MAG: transcription termination/antitermination protein NusG [Pseudomonadota bacterium]